MNCKPGQLAYTVSPFGGPRGVFVHVLRPAGAIELLNGNLFMGGGEEAAWVCSGYIQAPNGGCLTLFAIADACLRPIRDPGEDAQDETLSWKPVPLPAVDPSMLEVGK